VDLPIVTGPHGLATQKININIISQSIYRTVQGTFGTDRKMVYELIETGLYYRQKYFANFFRCVCEEQREMKFCRSI
jgi:hypothetical protein